MDVFLSYSSTPAHSATPVKQILKGRKKQKDRALSHFQDLPDTAQFMLSRKNLMSKERDFVLAGETHENVTRKQKRYSTRGFHFAAKLLFNYLYNESRDVFRALNGKFLPLCDFVWILP